MEAVTETAVVVGAPKVPPPLQMHYCFLHLVYGMLTTLLYRQDMKKQGFKRGII